MKKMDNGFKMLLATFWFCCVAVHTQAQNPDDTVRMQWWKDAKLGLFLHWGLYSEAGGDWKGHAYNGNEHFMLYEKIPWKEYGATLASRFNPTSFDADAWIKAAKNAGIKYIVITAKHHDGFAMYNSPSSDYNIVKQTPYAKDPMKLLAAACKKYGLKLCFYYSLGRDWQDPDVPTNWPVKAGRSNIWDFPDEDNKDLNKYLARKVKPQLNELLTQYGPIGAIWFDTPELITKPQSEEIKALIRSIQPNCIVNDRIGNGLGDYKTSEQKIADSIIHKPWEACVTMSGGWGYNKYDTVWKAPELLVRQLIDIVTKNGNFLLNVAPMGNGAFPQPATERLAAIGQWMKTNSEAIYGVSPWKKPAEYITGEPVAAKPVLRDSTNVKAMMDVLNDATSKKIFPEIRFAVKGKVLYVFANSLQTREVVVKSLGKSSGLSVEKIEMLGYKGKIAWQQQDDWINIAMPAKKANELNVYVFKLFLK